MLSTAQAAVQAAVASVAGWAWWVVSAGMAFSEWLNSLHPVVGMVVGAGSMLLVVWVAVKVATYLKFVYAMERLPGPMALPWLGNTLQLLGLLDAPRIVYVGVGGSGYRDGWHMGWVGGCVGVWVGGLHAV